jgi:hypothetical protein
LKKILALLAAAALVFAGTTPAKAGSEQLDTIGSGWDALTVSNLASISYTGSLVEGQTYTVSASGTACTTGDGGAELSVLNNPNLESGESLGFVRFATSPFLITSSPRVAGPAGTAATFNLQLRCESWPGAMEGNRTKFLRLTFESAVGSPINFSVFPQAGGTAFTTWGIANGATGYKVTATPGGKFCETTQNFCVISGLTPGENYTFAVVAINGSATSPAVSSGPIVLREPVTVGVGLNGGTWRVGETVTAQYAVQGSNATPTITWYRCPTGVGTMPTPPPAGECSSVGSGSSYVLAAGDVGKYVTAHVFVNNTDPQGQMTALSMTAVLASGATAPAPVADPAGNPTIVNIPNPIVSVAGGTEVTITGTGLAGVTAVTVGGLPAIVVSKTDTTVVVQVPVSTKTGLADLTITNDKGSVTSKSAIIYALNPVIKITKTKTITGFKAGQKVLTTAQKTAVKALITANPTLTTLACAAKTTGVASNKTELAKAKTLATATCAYAKTLKKTLIVSSTASQTLPKSKASRSVALTFKN